MDDSKRLARTQMHSKAAVMDRLAACGRQGLKLIRMFGNNEETALWFARLLAGVIDDLPEPEREKAVGGTYSHYVIATDLRPAIDAGPFLKEVRRALSPTLSTETQTHSLNGLQPKISDSVREL